jgi:hypothetical protein
MNKKLILPALVLMMAALFTANGFAQTCAGFTGQNVKYVGVGSSAQFNSFAFAAENLLTNAGNGLNFYATSTFPLLDAAANVTDTAKLWVAWDNGSDCAVYAYASVDSTVGVKSFFRYTKVTNSFATNFDAASAYGQPGQIFASCSSGTVVNAGQPACTGNLPSTLQSFLTTQPHPTCATHGAACNQPLPYCGQSGLSNPETGKWCFFNAGHADIRPEDTLYASTRALSAYNSTNGLAGLGYNDSTCGAVGTTEGCPILSSFGQGGKFNVEKFSLTGNDPFTNGGAVPTYVTLGIGATPVVVFVNDADPAGFGAGAPSYSVTNINRAVLSAFYQGTLACTGDLSPSGAGAGQPVQVVQREVLSGTYNTFEFTGVRTLTGSAAKDITENHIATTTWLSNDESGQELNTYPGLHWNSSGCPASASVIPSSLCGDPLYQPTYACGGGGTKGIKLRAIGTGEEVKDGLGYAFWGYGNFSPAATGCGTNSGSVTCGGYLGHYLTVDGIDPLFTTPGGALDSPPNPNGAYHLPQCYLKSGTPNCFAIPFTHILDGGYPLWTILRAVTFNATTAGQITPPGVVAMIAEAERTAGDSTKNLDDFVPLFTSISASAPYTGNLNLFVMRSHYKQSNISPVNGYAACSGNFVGIPLTPVAGACTVDAGGDVGGSVFTVQSDIDFNTDFAGVGTNPSEIYGLQQ